MVPVIIGSAKEVPGVIERLQMHWLTNSEPALRFALLSDLADAPEERMPDDSAVEQALVDGIQRLNARHGQNGVGRFHLLHRARRYNPGEGRWMGWERKRGKLEQLNQFVLGGDATAFSLQEGDSHALRGFRFVVTVDGDSILPPGSVARLVGTLAHPLNRPEFDQTTGRLCAGYTVVQPRVEISPESGARSLFSRLYTGDTAIDIYSRAVSDVYQDLFGSAVFVGKGIYDVAAFNRCLEARVPENALLSHDLLEGAHGRAALASDIVIYDGFPASYVEHIRRWHRWVRGDWQLLPWLAGRVPAADNRRIASDLSWLDRWKILDNLRRSIIPLALVVLAAAGWFALPGSPWVWTMLAVAAPGAYLFTDLITGLSRGRRRGAVRSTLRRLRNHVGRWFLALAFLLQDAVVSLDAVGRTLWRLSISRSHLLNWTSAAHTATRLAAGSPRANAWREIWPATAISAACTAMLAIINPAALFPAGPLLLLWFASPEIAAWISQRRRPSGEQLGSEERAFLRRVARHTWLFFETFVGPEDNWLAPDNFQEDPQPKVAHRTSPTNTGMLFLSSLTAWDFGYVGASDFTARVENCLETLDRLERYRGHFLNWYDTRDLAPLDPRYVSTVDSGNLAVCLITLKEGCLEIADTPVLRAAKWDGLADTLQSLAIALQDNSGELSSELSSHLRAMTERITAARDRPEDWHATLLELSNHMWPDLEATIAGATAPSNTPSTESLREIQVWLERVNHHLARMRWNVDALLPWLTLLEQPPKGCQELANQITGLLAPDMPLKGAKTLCARAARLLTDLASPPIDDAAAIQWLSELAAAIAQGAQSQADLQRRLLDCAARAEAMALAMDFDLLYDHETRLFHIGYNVSSGRIDAHHYDLLATEARLASYFAIAKRDVPTEHWCFLGRPISRSEGELSLLSWNGSMFEYLMPSLLLRSGAGKLLDEGERTAVNVQRRYASKLGVPWGISESAFAERDSDHHYRYQAFGVPALGLRRGLSRDIVIAPYATALSLAVFPVTAVRNLKRLAGLGLAKRYGFIEAADFTPERTRSGQSFTPVRAYMAHHQGMTMAAISNALHDNALVRRFSADMRMRAANLLLQERIPWELPGEISGEEEGLAPKPQPTVVPALYAWTPQSAEAFPQVHMIGNGRFATWISDAGAGAVWWHRHALTRWLPDTTRDNYGLWIYVRDRENGSLWSVGRQPTGTISQDTHVIFHPHMAEFHRRDDGIAMRMEVGVAFGDDLEIRRVTMVNETNRVRHLQVTSFGEVVLAPPLEDERHPAFSKLFVGSEYLQAFDGLLFTRRPRHPGDQPPALLHRIVLDHFEPMDMSYETDRSAFLGRNGSPRRPRGIVEELSGTTGWTLDPIMALQLSLELAPRETQQFAFLTIAAGSRESVFELAERYATLASLDWALNDAAREAAIEAQRLELQAEHLPQLQSLAALLVSPQMALRAAPSEIAANRLGQPRLWAHGLSGDLPILLLRMSDPRELNLLRLLIRAHQLWHRRLFRVDLVVLRMGTSGYEEPVRDRVFGLVREAGAHEMLGRNGGIHLVFADQITEDDRRQLECAASVVLDESRGSLAHQLAEAFELHPMPPRFEPAGQALATLTEPLARPVDLQFDNGMGGFSKDGKEYFIHLEPGDHTPAPWCNILANDHFGCLVTEAGGGFTWAGNSGEHRLTPWTNDSVCDPPSEVLYLRDEETAEVWTPTPAPAGASAACQIRHGAGYTKWLKRSHGFEQELTIFVAPDEPVKIARLRLRNLQPLARRITATYYAEWLLGSLRSISRLHIASIYDARNHALLVHNAWNPEFGERVAFLTSSHPPHSLTTDRRDFLGREGDLSNPAGLQHWDLGGRVETASDPCAAFQIHLEVPAGETREVAFVLGEGDDRAHASKLIKRWQSPERIEQAFVAVGAYWERMLGAVQVSTPDPGFDLMVNRWLLYQTVTSRIMARAGFYQAGGAIGFRDQLQDVLALLFCDPARARAHILDCAAHQFEEGDVLHWWHPPLGRGIRTRCSDDLLWLAYVTSRYVQATGDVAILSEDLTFLHAATLSADEDDRYARFETSPEKQSLFEHCVRALERGVTRGPHQLPLIGSSDWNDGMDRVGRRGRGESVWLGWFAIATMTGFADMAGRLDRKDLVKRWTKRADDLRLAVEQAGWDGEWYLRAIDDEGLAWGSHTSEECRINSIAQSWAVLSGAQPSDRCRKAVESAVRELVREDQRVIRLLWPPFHETSRDPGYIKAYPPGIRENGGQYSHAAAWLGLALAGLGDGDGAWRVFDIINPIRRSASRSDAERYRTEPYVLAADVAGVAPHIGRGGWTWYTGAAAWTWRLGVEAMLGLRLRGGELLIDPCLPKEWGLARAELRGPKGTLAIVIEDPEHLGQGAIDMTVGGVAVSGATVAFPTDGSVREVRVRLRQKPHKKKRAARSHSVKRGAATS